MSSSAERCVQPLNAFGMVSTELPNEKEGRLSSLEQPENSESALSDAVGNEKTRRQALERGAAGEHPAYVLHLRRENEAFRQGYQRRAFAEHAAHSRGLIGQTEAFRQNEAPATCKHVIHGRGRDVRQKCRRHFFQRYAVLEQVIHIGHGRGDAKAVGQGHDMRAAERSRYVLHAFVEREALRQRVQAALLEGPLHRSERRRQGHALRHADAGAVVEAKVHVLQLTRQAERRRQPQIPATSKHAVHARPSAFFVDERQTQRIIGKPLFVEQVFERFDLLGHVDVRHGARVAPIGRRGILHVVGQMALFQAKITSDLPTPCPLLGCSRRRGGRGR